MALTATQIEDIRQDIGDTGAVEAFTDAEIERAYDRTDALTSENTRLSATRGILIRQLMASASKLNDYTAGATSEKRSQIFAQLKQMFAMYARAVDAAEGTTGTSTARVSIRNVPRPTREYPDSYFDDTETA